MPNILSPRLAEDAFAIVRPAIVAAMEGGVTDRRALAVVITATRDINPWKEASEAGFRDACHLITSIGDLSQSAFPNLEIALKKAELSARHGRSTSQLPPQYLAEGDTIFWGSAVLDGIVVACAGLEERLDEMFSHWIAATVQACAKSEVQGRRSSLRDESFL